MREQLHDNLSLFGRSGSRKYLNAAERQHFTEIARRAAPKIRLFCLTLGWSGARISEVLALTPASIDIESGVANPNSQASQVRYRAASTIAAGRA